MSAAGQLRTVVVLFNPDAGVIASVLQLAVDGSAPLVVANAVEARLLKTIRAAAIEVLANDRNLGLAFAFNQGIEQALRSGATHVMLLDQDTRPPADMAERLLELALRLERSGRSTACIAPAPVDRKQMSARTLAARIGTDTAHADAVEVLTVISSGMLIPRSALMTIGGMWNELFIDHIDHEWCFRARAAGLSIVAAPGIAMPHDMGDRGFRFLGRYKPIHISPTRHFHIVRNTLWLARCSFIPRQWRLREVAKLTLRIPAYVVFSSAPLQTLRLVAAAILAGLGTLPPRTFSASAC